MKQIEQLQQQADACRQKVQECAEVIKSLQGYTPDNFLFTFSINGATVTTVPINEEEGNFCVGVFMAWHQFYSRKLKEITATIAAMTPAVAV